MIGLARPSGGFCGENRNQTGSGPGWLRVLKFEPEIAAVRGQLGLNPPEPAPNATLAAPEPSANRNIPLRELKSILPAHGMPK
jgi:hypothetical protein